MHSEQNNRLDIRNMKVAIMQPYFLPYIGYWQLLNHVDKFVLYDNIKYTKKGWINRNQMLRNDSPDKFSLPLRKDSNNLNISQRYISEVFEHEKFLRKMRGAYFKAKYFKKIILILEDILNYKDKNLFNFLLNSILIICNYLNIDSSKIVISSSIKIDHSLKSKQKVITICKSLNAKTYVNPIGGVDLYKKSYFKNNKLDLKFIKPILANYKQNNQSFIPALSIIDVMMFNSKKEISYHMQQYKIV